MEFSSTIWIDLSPTPSFLSKIKSYAWLAVAGLGIVGAAHQLANMVMLIDFPGGVWCTGLAAVAVFVAMATIGVLKTRHSLGWFVWVYVPSLAVIGVFLTGGQWYFVGPICFGGSGLLP